MALRGQVSHNGIGWPTHLIGLLGPALAGLIVTAWCRGPAGLRDLFRRCTTVQSRSLWYLLAIPAAAVAAIAIAAVLGNPPPAWSEFGEFSGAPLLSFPVLFAYVFVVNGLGEEVGWRGYLVDELLPRHGVLTSAAITWTAWAGWHLPLFWVVDNFRSMSLPLIGGWLFALAAGSIVLTALYASFGRSVLFVALWHTAFNLTTGVTGAQGWIAALVSTMVMIFAIALVVRRGRVWLAPGNR